MVNAQRFQRSRKGPCEEIKVLKYPKNPKIQHQRKDKPLLAVGVRAAGGYFLGDQKIHRDRKSTRRNSSHDQISYAVFCLKKKKQKLDVYNHNDESLPHQ